MARQRAQAFVQQMIPKNNTPREPTKKRRPEDEGNTDSQQMLALGALLKKPKGDEKEIKQFRSKAEADQRELNELLRQRMIQAEKENRRRRDDLASLISQVLQTPNRRTEGDVATFPETKIANNLIFESAVKVNAACYNLLKEYTQFESMIVEMAGEDKKPVTETWTREVEETERLLRLGHETALRNVKKVLGAEDGDGENGVEAGEEEMVGGEMKGPDLNFELLKSLRYAERGIKRMAKALPKDG